MKTGVILPSFRDTPGEALAVAAAAEEAGVDGVFCYDHLWPMGQPERPALAPFPLLGMVARRTERVHVGTLVARIGLVPDRVLLAEFGALSVLAPGRVIAGLGTGDRQSAAENEAYGVPSAPADERRAAVGRCAVALRDRGLEVWVGGGSRGTRLVAEEAGVAVNLWDVPPAAVAEQARRSEVTWGGPVPKAGRSSGRPPSGGAPAGADAGDGEAIAHLLAGLARAGATWAVFVWPVPLATVVACARTAASGR